MEDIKKNEKLGGNLGASKVGTEEEELEIDEKLKIIEDLTEKVDDKSII